MSKLQRASIALTFIFILAGTFFVSQANAQTSYYSNSFDSASALNDGYWTYHDTDIQSINGSSVLNVDGEASFKPEVGNYALDNFTVQFDVYHNVRYENNSAFAGAFYEATDSQNNAVITMGYVQRGFNGALTQQGFLEFYSGASHYFFPFGQSDTWSTWRLTVTIAAVDTAYFANVSLQVDGELITAFATDRPLLGEVTVSNITNEQITNPVMYQNLLPLSQPGNPVPTYAPTYNSKSGIHYDLMSNNQAKPVSNNNGATPSYIDNFYYGYANAVPLSAATTSTLASNDGGANPTDNGASSTPTSTQQPPTTPLPITTLLAVISIAVISIAVIVAVVLVRTKKLKK